MIPDPSTLLLFFSACLALYVAPGPDMLYIASQSLGEGRRAGIVSALGVCSGLLVHTLGAALGLSALLGLSPIAYQLVKGLGVAYLIYLGARILFDHDPAPFGTAAGIPRRGAWHLYRQGALINLLNPKIALFFVAFLPQFVDPSGPFVFQMLFFGLLFTISGLAWTVFLAVTFGRVGRWLSRHSEIWRWQRRFTGLLLIGLALHLAIADRR